MITKRRLEWGNQNTCHLRDKRYGSHCTGLHVASCGTQSGKKREQFHAPQRFLILISAVLCLVVSIMCFLQSPLQRGKNSSQSELFKAPHIKNTNLRLQRYCQVLPVWSEQPFQIVIFYMKILLLCISYIFWYMWVRLVITVLVTHLKLKETDTFTHILMMHFNINVIVLISYRSDIHRGHCRVLTTDISFCTLLQ